MSHATKKRKTNNGGAAVAHHLIGDCEKNQVTTAVDGNKCAESEAVVSPGCGCNYDDQKLITLANESVKEAWLRIACLLTENQDGCLIYGGKVNNERKSPLVFFLKTKKMYLEKFAYILNFGPVPPGMFVRHCSKNRLCCKAAHLELRRGVALVKEDYDKKKYESMLANSITNNQGCLLWQGPKNEHGYGVIGYRGRYKRVHILSWLINKGPIQKGLILRHRCKQGNEQFKNNTECFFVGHLEPGTHLENSKDQAHDGTLPRGDTHAKSKLTADQVQEIYAGRLTTSAQIRAKKYGVHITTISAIDHGYSWSHITGASTKKKDNVNKKNRAKQQVRASKETMLKAWERVVKTSTRRGKFGCLIPQTTPDAGGYSVMSIQGVKRRAHIVAWELFHNDGEPIANDLQVRHVVCSDRKCFEISHVISGTSADNNRDHLMRSNNAKKAIKFLESAGKGTLEERAAAANITVATAKKIDDGSSWGWLLERLKLQKIYEENALKVCRDREQLGDQKEASTVKEVYIRKRIDQALGLAENEEEALPNVQEIGLKELLQGNNQTEEALGTGCKKIGTRKRHLSESETADAKKRRLPACGASQ